MEPLFTRRRLLAAAASAGVIEYFRRRENTGSPARFNDAFRTGATWPGDGGRTYRLETVEAGVLHLPTGELFALEPWSLADRYYKPLRGRFPRGQHRVTLAVATIEPGHRRVAAARLEFAAGPAVTWHASGGYPVDGGTGCFCDAALADHLRSLPNQQVNSFTERILQGFGQNREPLFVDVRLEEAGANVISFSTGFGDGRYANWLGRAADGRVVQVVTDFDVLPGLTGEG